MNEPLLRVLLVEERPKVRLLEWLGERSANAGLLWLSAATLEDALRLCRRNPLDVILVNIGPGIAGLKTLKRMIEEVPGLPMVALGDSADERAGMEAVRLGAQDYLTREDVSGPRLARALRYAVERNRMREALLSLSLTDELTGLYNRRGFMAMGKRMLELAIRAELPCLLVYADVDGLKRVNDRHGHAAGDEVIAAVAEGLRRSVRAADLLARLGGDEFGALLVHSTGEAAEVTAGRMRELIGEALDAHWAGSEAGISLGISIFNPLSPVSMQTLIDEADAGMYTMKHRHAA